MVKGGIIILDDYGTVAGETEAVDKFIMDNKLDLKIVKPIISNIPSYFIKL